MDRTEQYVNTLSRMIACETVSSFGQTDLEKFHSFHQLLKELFPHLFAIVELEEFDGSLLLRWPGKDCSLDPVCFMNHHDVVEANGWTHDPFHPDVRDGKLYGRGTLDTKGGLFAMLQAAEELVTSGYQPQRDIYFESACNEECSGDGCDAITQELQKRGIHFYFTLDEGGMIVDEPISGVKGKWAMIGVGEKGTVDLKFTARSQGGHASTPGKNTPLVRLGKFMYDVEHSHIFRLEMAPVIKEMLIRFSDGMEDGLLKKALQNTERLQPLLTHLAPAVSPVINALLRTTLAFTAAKGADCYNVLPQEAYVVGNMRFSHHQGHDKSIAAITKFAKKYDIETEIISDGFSSRITDFNGEPFHIVENTIAEIFPDVKCAPYLMTGASDSRYMDRVCENCIRFTPFVVTSEQVSTIHGVDENVDVSCLSPAVDFFKKIMLGV